MGYLPIFVDVHARPCIVIGGGESAEAKVRALLEAGAIVTVVSPDPGEQIRSRAAAGQIRHSEREYEYGDLRGKLLAYIAGAGSQTVSRVATEARELGILLNVVDQPDSSTFITPAILRRGGLQIAISTSGSSPALARMLRESLEQQLGSGYGSIVEILRRARQFLRRREPDQRVRAGILNALAAALMDSVERLDEARLEQVLRAHLDAGAAELGPDLQSGLKQESNQ